MALRGTRIYLAADASAVTAAVVLEGVKGRRLGSVAREPLAASLLVPGAAGANLVDPDAVRVALGRVLDVVGRDHVTLVLPDGIARLVLVEPPGGTDPREYVRFRLAGSLPWPAAEASVDTLEAGPGRVVGAALRRTTVAEYEQVARAAGAQLERVHLAPLMALAGLLRARRGDAVHALLGDVALCLALLRDGALVALRCRRRDRSPGEASRLREEMRRLSSVAGNGQARVDLVASGSDASRLLPELGGGPAPRLPPAALPSGAEAGWLGSLLA